jgi:hypothetical protein
VSLIAIKLRNPHVLFCTIRTWAAKATAECISCFWLFLKIRETFYSEVHGQAQRHFEHFVGKKIV